jgi:cysteine desulfurase family protein (TIGR01976 family)
VSALERRHCEAVALQLLPVELGLLAVSTPHDRLPGVVDAIGELEPAVEVHTGDDGSERGCDTGKGVVVVVEHDHATRVSGSASGPVDALTLARRGQGRHASHDSLVFVVALALDVDAVRARFSALDTDWALFDAPGGTQVPDSVIDAIVGYLRESNANLGGAFEASVRSDALVTEARLAASAFLGATPDEVVFGQNMTTLNFALTRALGRELRTGDEIVTTRLDHDANVAPWLELAQDLDLTVRLVELHDDTTLDLDDLERKLSERTRVVAFPLAANAVGTLVEARRVAELAHGVGALAWADAVHYAPHGPIDVATLGVDVLFCSPYKFFGPHLGVAFGRAEVLERWRAYKVRPSPNEPVGARFETGTLPHELLAGLVAAIDYLDGLGWDAIRAHEEALGERFLAGLGDGWRLHGLPTMDGRVPTFALTHPTLAPDEVARRLAERKLAVWSGDYYAVEVMERLGLTDGALRVGVVHYNTAGEVDRLLEALAEV